MTESFISLKCFQSGTVALFALIDLIIFFLSSLEARVKSNLQSLVKNFPLWLRHYDDFCKVQLFFIVAVS